MSDRTGAFVRAGTSYSQIRAAFSHLLIQAGGLLAFVRTPQRCAHPRDEVRAEQLTAYRQVSGCKGKQILGITQRLMLGIT